MKSPMMSALVIGASRGIGRQIALTLARNGYGVTVAAKTVESTERLPGSIHTVVDEIQRDGGVAFPVQCDCRQESDVRNAVRVTHERFGRLDAVIYNAGAITWQPVLETPLKRLDLMLDVNVRGAYVTVQESVPVMLQQKFGRLVLVAPPIYNRFFKGKTPYSITKVGMTVLAMGLANELRDTGVSICTLWPATVIQSHVTDVMHVPRSHMRTPDIFADAVCRIVQEPTDKLNGKVLLDEDYLRSEGVTDFTRYRCDPDVEPPRMMPRALPDLTVQEEHEQLNILNKDSKLLNGKVLLDEDYLRSEGVTDFTRYRCDPDVEPPRMMPRALPDLTVQEEHEQLNILNKDSKL
ncbi:hydroxysteroid dehydrogenase-like protein 2 isoform X2 [Dreissena polymorpha]|uniref:hydroxysteroid dehydrogenase-like protein 2 isoform X2 n=2 Tax=Dreissena polymorpha TaxID=45954 RepID=UPI002264BB57|nr:hydroxysteroid dehydrogenase-like protein 2 isoform X2 [Dreissena polymorpha]